MRAEPLYIFAYGSQMWDPSFEFESWSYGVVKGYHRSPCIYSTIYHGTDEHPGLVFGLDEGGECEGIVYRVSSRHSEKVLTAIRRKEMPTGLPVYIETLLPVTTADGIFSSVTFIANQNCIKYAGHLSDTARVELMAKSVGENGPCLDYYKAAVERMAKMGIQDEYLTNLICRAEIFVSRELAAEVSSNVA